MKDERVRAAIGHLVNGEYGKALPIVRELDREQRESPEAKRRREMKALAAKVEKELAPAAAAYARWQKKGGQ